jgi:hypothetical protein
LGTVSIGQWPKRGAEACVEKLDFLMIIFNVDDGNGAAPRLKAIDAVREPGGPLHIARVRPPITYLSQEGPAVQHLVTDFARTLYPAVVRLSGEFNKSPNRKNIEVEVVTEGTPIKDSTALESSGLDGKVAVPTQVH